MEKKKIFEVVKASEKLPEVEKEVVLIWGERYYVGHWNGKNHFVYDDGSMIPVKDVTYWLKETEKYVLSEEQLSQLLGEAHNSGLADESFQEFLKDKGI